MSTRHLLALAFACMAAFGCSVRVSTRSHDTGIAPSGRDGGPAFPHDTWPPQADAFVATWVDTGPTHHDAGATARDAATSSPEPDAFVAATDVGVMPQMVTGATRCFDGEPVRETSVFVGTTCGAIDLVGASCGRPGAPERYFSALGTLAGGSASTYLVEVDPPEFVIQEMTPTEVGFDCPAVAGACSSGHRMIVGSDLVQFMIERGTGGCGEFRLTATAISP